MIYFLSLLGFNLFRNPVTAMLTASYLSFEKFLIVDYLLELIYPRTFSVNSFKYFIANFLWNKGCTTEMNSKRSDIISILSDLYLIDVKIKSKSLSYLCANYNSRMKSIDLVPYGLGIKT